jgi:hypothetical protein
MSDLRVEEMQLVDPTNDIKRKWVEVKIQECRSRKARHQQDMEDLIKGKLVDLEARILMLDLELKKLEQELVHLTVIDV